MAVMGKHGITAETPKNILFGAGTYHTNLKFAQNKWTGECIGATSGGGKMTLQGEYTDIAVDGALVKVKGLTIKTGGKATMEVNMTELSKWVLKNGGLMEEEESDATGYTMLKDKPHIEEGDYLENFGFVGQTADGSKNIIVIFEQALCTSGLEFEPKNKEGAVVKLTIEAYADNDGNLDTLPVKIYYPTT